MPVPTVFHSPLNRIALVLAIAAVLASAACGTSGADDAGTTPSPAVTRRAPARPTEPIDARVDIGAGRLHLRCAGDGETTVVLVAGWGDGGDRWGPVETDLAADARVCAYARFGTGTSDPPPETQTFTTQADDLHSLLEAAGEPGPYVVVGHSFGGAAAVAFAARHGGDVSGLVLIDTSPMTWPQPVCAVPDNGSDMAAIFRSTCAQMSDPASNPEQLDAVRAFREIAATPPLGDLPTVVLTRAAPVYPGLADEAARNLASAWLTGQDQWAALSEEGRVVPVDTAEHFVHHADPTLVTEEIRRLLR